MSGPSRLCSTCLNVLQSGLEDVLERTLYKECTHHATFAEFQDAVAQECFICVKLYNSIRDDVLAGWEGDSTNWRPLECSLTRRPWAPELYGAIYWHIAFMEFGLEQLDMVDLNYRGNVFCLFKIADNREPRTAEDGGDAFENSTAPAKVHEQAYKWYKVCCESHETCKKLGSGERYTPTRLIDVGAESEDTWRLGLCTEDITDSPNYLTLSYRWAKNLTVLLLNSTIDDFRRGAPISSLPKTFRDAITVARHFSIRYLWIDSLCIIQDSPEDWSRESVLMQDVYAKSACNISASASDSPDGGLFRSRKPEEVYLGCINVELPKLGTKKFEVWDEFYMNRLTYGPLTNRGWIFQERVLSPRVLHFSQNQIAWDCFEMSKCETFPNWSPYPTEVNYPRGLKTLGTLLDSDSRYQPWPAKESVEKKAMSETIFNQWTHMVQTYSQCALTCPDDRLIAMTGVAKMFERYTGDEYLAGLWRSRLVEGLNWVVVDPVARPQNRFRAPSWSWAAVDSPCLPQLINLTRDRDLIEIIDVKVDLPNSPTDWQQVSGFVELRGCQTKAIIRESRAQNSKGTIAIKVLNLPFKIFVLPDTIDVTLAEGNELYFLPLRSTLRQMVDRTETKAEKILGTAVVILEGMVLESVIGKEDVYRRIGRFVVDDLDHVGLLGLRAFPPFPEATAYNVAVDEARTSIITLV